MLMRDSDLRSVIGLLHEVYDLARKPRMWKQHLLARLCDLLGAHTGGWALFDNVLPRRVWQLAGDDSVCRYPLRSAMAWRQTLGLDDQNGPMRRIAGMPGRLVTVMDEPMTDHASGNGSRSIARPPRHNGADDCIYSLYRLGRRGWGAMLALHREPAERRPFGERERQMVHLVHSGLDILYANEPAAAFRSSAA